MITGIVQRSLLSLGHKKRPEDKSTDLLKFSNKLKLMQELRSQLEDL